MQIVGVVGEGAILLALPAGHPILQGSLVRFILFDAAGVVLLVGAMLLTLECHIQDFSEKRAADV